MKTEILLPLLTLLLGWALKAFEPSFGSRRERRRAVGEALVEILENLAFVVEARSLFRTLEADFGQSPTKLLTQQKASLANLDDDVERMSESYTKARLLIAGVDPLLALDLHAVGSVRRWVLTAFRLATCEPERKPELHDLQVRYLASAETTLARAAVRLARHHGFRTYLRVRSLARDPSRLQSAGGDFAEVCRRFLANMERGTEE